jgi:hypothetical protein
MTIDHLEALDAVLRFAVGQDLGDRDLYETAFTESAVLDFREPSLRFGAEVPLMKGRATIMEMAFPATQHLITTHTVTNTRVTQTPSGADLYALVEAQHVVPSEPSRRLLLKNHYFVEVVAGAPGARIQRLRIEMAWSAGDPEVLFASSEDVSSTVNP